MDSQFTPGRRRLTNVAVAMAVATVMGIAFGLLVRGGGTGGGLKSGAGAALVLLALTIGGGVFAAQATEALMLHAGED